MNIEEMQSFVLDIIDFSKENHIHGELVPMDSIQKLEIHPQDIEYIKKFVKENPVVIDAPKSTKKYVNFSGHKFLNISYTQPEGFKHKNQPFIPTWILTAMILARVVRNLDVREVFDLFAGDGRIQYFAKTIGLTSYGIEYSKELVDIQKKITERTGVGLGTIQGDALKKRDYSSYHLKKPAFFISAVWPEEEMAMSCLNSSLKEYAPNLLEKSLFLTIHESYDPRLKEMHRLTLPTQLDKRKLDTKEKYSSEVICNLTLPHYWEGIKYHISKLKV